MHFFKYLIIHDYIFLLLKKKCMHNVYVDILNKNTNNNINKKSQTKKKFYSILMKIRLSRQFTTFKKKI